MATTRDIKCPTCGAASGKICRSLKSGKPLPDDHASRRLISINEAVKLGHARLRKPIWANPAMELSGTVAGDLIRQAKAEERERCAKIAEGWIRPNAIPDTIGGAESRAGRLIAAEIRNPLSETM